MLKYLKNSDISFRINFNPINWKWIPAFPYEGPTPFYPKRRTYACVWLFLQIFLDIDDGTTDMRLFNKIFHKPLDVEIYDETEMGPSPPRVNKTNLDLE